ncbi:hypothetical protein J6590_019132 [Homalodisca vitripennis]|nr:hypothetical protein J6590_019132 [Homalodisca vitripennis]
MGASRDLGFDFCKLELIFFSKRASSAQHCAALRSGQASLTELTYLSASFQ